MLIEFENPIDDGSILGQRYIIRDGFVFTSISEPGNVYNALVIRNPYNVLCFSPRFPNSPHSLQEHIHLVNALGVKHALVIGTDIHFLPQCPTLTCIRIIPADCSLDGFDFSPLYQMPNIHKLFCKTVYGDRGQKSGYVDYSKIHGLKKLSLVSEGQQKFSKVQHLQELRISGFAGSKGDLTDLFCSTELEKLMMIKCKNRNLKGIEQSKCIQSVELSYNRSLADISHLTEVSSTLKVLIIENCPKITDFGCLSELGNLEYLGLFGKNILPDLGFLRKLTHLKKFEFSVDVADGDLYPCLTIPYVYSKVDRKHFNLKNRDLPPIK